VVDSLYLVFGRLGSLVANAYKKSSLVKIFFLDRENTIIF
jgi:hypothetical protein